MKDINRLGWQREEARGFLKYFLWKIGAKKEER